MEEGKPEAAARGVIKVRCSCGKVMTARKEHEGKKVRCPGCKVTLTVGEAPGAAPKAAGCKNHPGDRKVGVCMVCKAPICSFCRDTLGYFCTEECKAKARVRHEVDEPSAEEKEETAKAEEHAGRAFRWMVRGGGAAAGLGVVWLVYSFFFATRGTITWQVAGTDFGQMMVHEDCLVTIDGKGKLIKYAMSDGAVRGEVELALQGGAMVDEDTDFFSWGGGHRPVKGAPGHVVVASGDAVVGVSLAETKVAWRREGGASNLVVTERHVAFVDYPRRTFRLDEPEEPEKEKPRGPELVCLDGLSGAEKWRGPVPDLKGGVTMEGGGTTLLLYVRTFWRDERDPAPEGDQVVALGIDDGKELWRAGGGFTIASKPLFLGERVVIPTNNGLTCVEGRTGKQAWTYALPSGADTRGGVKLWPVGEVIYFSLGEGLICLDVASGKERWMVSVGGEVKNLEEQGPYLVLAGETASNSMEELAKGPLLTPGADMMRTILTKEMPKMLKLTPFTMILDPAQPKVVAVLEKLSGRATILDDTLILVDMARSARLEDALAISGIPVGETKIKWQHSIVGSMYGGIFHGDRVFGILTTPGKTSEEFNTALVSIHLD